MAITTIYSCYGVCANKFPVQEVISPRIIPDNFKYKIMQEDEREKVHMTTLTECLISLKQEGFDKVFAINEANELVAGDQSFKPSEVKIDNFYRFEGESDPGDEEILYALETSNGTRGILSYVYGPLTSENDQAASNFIKKVRTFQSENPKST